MSAISNTEQPDIPPSVPPIEVPATPETLVAVLEGKPKSPATGPIRSNDTETTIRHNPMPKKYESITARKTKLKEGTKSKAQSTAGSAAPSVTATPVNPVIDLPAPEKESDNDIDRSHIAMEITHPNTTPTPEDPGHIEHPGMIFADPIAAPTFSPAPELPVQPETNAIVSAMSANLFSNALSAIAVPSAYTSDAVTNGIAAHFTDFFSRFKEAMDNRLSYEGHPLKEGERYVIQVVESACDDFQKYLDYIKLYSSPAYQGDQDEVHPMDDDSISETPRAHGDSWYSDYPVGLSNTTAVKQEEEEAGWSKLRWSESPEVARAPKDFTPMLNDDQAIEMVKLMSFISNRSRPSTEAAKDTLAQFNPVRFNHFVQLTEEDLTLPPSFSRESTLTPKPVRVVDAPSEEDLLPPPPSTRDNTPMQPTIRPTSAPRQSAPVATIPASVGPKKTSTIEDKVKELKEKHHPSTPPVATPSTTIQKTPARKPPAPEKAKDGVKTFADAIKKGDTITPTQKTNPTPTPAPAHTPAKPKKKANQAGQSAKGLQYLAKFTPPIPKTWNDHNMAQHIRERIKQRFEKIEQERGKQDFPRCLSVNFTTHNHLNIVFSPETTHELVAKWAEAIIIATEAPGLGFLTPNKEWTKMLVSHVPTHFMNVDTGEFAPTVSSNDILDLVVRDNIPPAFFQKYPMPVKPRWFRHPNTLEKLGHRHDRIVLTVEDEDNTAISELQKLGVAFGLRPSYITRFTEKPRMSLCNRCCSYECPNPRNCRRHPRCGLCGDKHTTQTHNAKCKLCIAEGRTNIIDGKSCTHEAKCFACKGNHEFGDHKCESRKAYRRGIAEVLAEEKTRQTVPSSVNGEDDDDIMSQVSDDLASTATPKTTGLITQQPIDTSAPGASSATAINVDEY